MSASGYRYRVKVVSAKGHVHYSDFTFPTREDAKEYIRRKRREGGWSNCRIFTVPE